MADGNVGAGLGYAADLLHTAPGIDSRSLLAAIVASSDDAIVGLSTDGTILSWNHAAEELFGYPADDALGRSVFITVEDAAMERELRGLLEHIHSGGHVRHYETVRTTKSGERRDVSITLSPVHDAAGSVVGASKIVRDVTIRKRHEAAKRDFTFLVEHSHDFVGISGLDLIPAFVNEAGLKMVGLGSLDEARRVSVLDHFFPEDRQFIAEEFLPLVLRDGHGEIEIRFRHFRTGDPIWVVYGVLTLRDDHGNPTGYATISQDVTHRKQSEESLRESESRLRTLMDNLPDGAVYQITQGSDVDKRFTFVSGGIDRIFGVTPERAVADPAALYGTIHEEDRDQLLAAEVESLRSRRRFDCEFRHHMPDGEIRWVHCQSAPREVDGLVIWEGVLLDVTDRKRAEAALGESEARYRCLFESIDEGFCIIEVLFGESGEAVDYRFMTVNPVFERQSGLKDVVGRRMRELAPDHEPHWFEAYGRVVRTGEPVRFVNEAKALGGRWFDVNAFRIGGPESRQIGVLFTDISDRIRAEAAVRESERRTRTILESITDAFFALDRNWRFTYVNGRAEEFLGRTRVELVGRGLWDEFPDARESEFEGYYRTAMDESVPVAFEAYYPSHERWYDVNVYPSADGLSVYFRDANQRRRAERTNRFLADASAALAGLLDFESTLQRVARLAVPDFADWCVVDLLVDGGVRRLAVTSGDPAKEGLAQELVEKYPAQLSAPYGVGRVLRTGQPELIEVVSPLFLESVTQNDDHLRIAREIGLRSYVSVPLLSQGRVLGALTFLTAESGRRYDETDLRVATDLAGRAAVAIENARLYREVREADRRKDEFLAMLAHELRNPLAPIRSGLDLLKLSDAEPEVVSLMAGQVEHIVRLVDDLLDVSRILRGRVELKLKPVELSELVQRAVETVRPAIDTQRQVFSVSLPAEPVPLEADPVRLTQVFTNLLGNASKYTEPGGRIDLTAERDGEYIEVRVSDTGVGIDPELLPHVFELFRQSTRSIDRAQGGLGIGLTIVKSLTEMHGGHVLARSEGAGRGSDFVIRLPVLNYDAAAATTSTDGPPVPARRILVVDDNVPAAKLLVRLLRKLGPHEVVTAHDGEGALTAAKAYRPDLILLDIGLPRLDGYEVARRLRERPDIGETVIIALTGYGTEDDRRRSAEAGFDDHVTKPPSVEMLQKVLAHPKLVPRSGRQ